MKKKKCKQFQLFLILIGFLLSFGGFVIQAQDKNDDSKLLEDFIKAQGHQNTIVFDASNIKQFWVDKSVMSKNDLIFILLRLRENKQIYESIPLKIQLANVYINQKCRIDVISDDPTLNFSISSDKSNDISTSESNMEFIDYHIVSREFPIVSSQNKSFFLNFNSKTNSTVSISKIVLSFSTGNEFVNELSTFPLTKENLTLRSSSFCDGDEIMIKGVRSRIFFNNKIPIDEKKEFLASTKIKNIGSQPTKIFVGYAIFNKEGLNLDGKNYPFSLTDPILNVISADEGSNTIVVDKYPSWRKDCYIALEPKEDFSDIPNVNLLPSRIISIAEESDGKAVITLDSPLKSSLEKGTKIRIHGITGLHIYTDTRILNPGDDYEFSSAIKQDDRVLQYSSVGFSRGVFFIQPVILSYSENNEVENTILISDLQLYSSSK